MQADVAVIEARAFIFDLLSVSFAYPTEELYQSLLDGEYVKELQQHIVVLPQQDRRNDRHANRHLDIVDKLAAYPHKAHAETYNDFEAEYIALFEHSNDLPALHLNAHLYSDGEPQPVPVFQRLLTQYRDFGIEMTSDHATEQPDHLSVELEFFSYLHKLLLQDNDERGLQKIQGGIEDFCVELQWTRNWLEKMQDRRIHAFYNPLAQLLVCMLDVECKG